MASIAQIFLATPVSVDRLLAAARQDAELIAELRALHMPVADFVTDWADSLESLLDADLEDVLIHGAKQLATGHYSEMGITFKPALDWHESGEVVLSSATQAKLSLVNLDGSVAKKSSATIEFVAARNWRARLVLALEAQSGARCIDYFQAQQLLRLPERLHL